MNEKRKGIILDDKMERYIELDTSYLPNYKRIKSIYKYEMPNINYFDEDNIKKRSDNFEVTSHMVVLVNDGNSSNPYFVINKDADVIKCMKVIRTDKQIKKPWCIELKSTSDGVTDYVECNKIYELDISKVTNIEYYVYEYNYSKVNKKYHDSLKCENDHNKKNHNNYEFGDILSVYGTKEKFVFICQSGRFIYTCSTDSYEMFTGINKIAKKSVVSKFDELKNTQKQMLLSKLNDALELDRCIPLKAKENVSRLVFKYKTNNS